MSAGRRIVLSEEDFNDSESAQSTSPAQAAVSSSAGDGARDSPVTASSTGAPEQPPNLLRAEPHPRIVASPSTRSVAGPSGAALPIGDRPRVGGWGFAIFFFGLIGGAIGYFALKRTDPQRADHVLKWGLIITAISIAAWIVLWVIVLAIVAHGASSGALGVFGGSR